MKKTIFALSLLSIISTSNLTFAQQTSEKNGTDMLGQLAKKSKFDVSQFQEELMGGMGGMMKMMNNLPKTLKQAKEDSVERLKLEQKKLGIKKEKHEAQKAMMTALTTTNSQLLALVKAQSEQIKNLQNQLLEQKK